LERIVISWIIFNGASHVNLAICALGGFMLFALAVGFFAAPV
jgi:hypothetical protein